MQSEASSLSVEELVLRLHDIHAICLDGPYTLKSGIVSPFYVDLRLIVSHPAVLQSVSSHMYGLVRSCSFDVVCGVPYTALPIATLMSASHGVPMVMRRKEGSKAYGLRKSIEGVWVAGQTCLVVEDLVTSGLSVFETIEPLQAAGLRVSDVVVLINREQGGRENIEGRGVRLHALVTITEVMRILKDKGRIKQETVDKVEEFVRNSKMEIKNPAASMSPTPASPSPSGGRLTYAARIPHAVNPAARALLRIMEAKQTNLCLSADVTSSARLLRLADDLGPHICLLKTHVDILDDWDAGVVASLRSLARRHKFLLFEDRKYADIGSTVSHQYAGGPFRVAQWSHVTNCHIVPGPGIIKGLQQAAVAATATALTSSGGEAEDEEDRARGLLLIAEMSSEGSLAVGDYTSANVRLAESDEHSAFVMGFICQHRLSDRPGLLHLSPGVQLPPAGQGDVAPASASASTSAGSSTVSVVSASTGGDSLGQQYHSPSSIIGSQGSDIIIVGRAILAADDPLAEARRYQQAGWKAYLDAVDDANQ